MPITLIKSEIHSIFLLIYLIMDIFSFTKRGKKESINRPLNYPESDKTEKKL